MELFTLHGMAYVCERQVDGACFLVCVCFSLCVHGQTNCTCSVIINKAPKLPSPPLNKVTKQQRRRLTFARVPDAFIK